MLKISKPFRHCITVLMITLVALAIIINIIRLTMPLLGYKRAFFEVWASKVLKQPVQIQTIVGGWRGFEPEITFKNVLITRPLSDGSVIKIKKLSIGIDVINSLLQWKLLPGRLILSGTRFEVIQNNDGSFSVKGVPAANKVSDIVAPNKKNNDLLIWLLTQTNMTLQNIDILWRGKNGLLLPIHNLTLVVENGPFAHRIMGSVHLEQTIPTRLSFVLNLKDVNFSEKRFDASLYLQAHDFIFKQWLKDKMLAHYLKGMRINSGIADLKLWASWQHGKLQHLQTLFNLRHVGIDLPAKNKKQYRMILINKAQANGEWERKENGWDIRADHIHAEVNGVSWPENRIGYRIIYGKGKQPERHILRLDFLRLQELEHFSKRMGYWPKQLRDLYTRFNPRGSLRNLELEYWNNPKHHFNFILATNFNHLRLKHWHHVPGIVGFSGSIYFSPNGGILRLDNKRSEIYIPELFTAPLKLHLLKANVVWKKTKNGVEVKATPIELSDDNFMTGAQMQLYLPTKGPEWVDLIAGYKLKDMHNIKRYLPDKILTKRLYRWLTHAILHGQFNDGTLLLRGPLFEFPFDRHRGRFELVGHFNKVGVKFNPLWPSVDNCQGTLIFDGSKMQINVAKATTLKNPIDHIKGVIYNIRRPVLVISGEGNSTLDKGIAYLRKSPLSIGKRLVDVKASGPMQAELHFRIPFQRSKKARVYSRGDIRFSNSKLALTAWGIRLNELSGLMHFRNTKVWAPKITGMMFGNPIKIYMSTRMHNRIAKYVQLNIKGIIGVAGLRKYYKSRWLKYFQGSAPYRGILRLRSRDQNTSNTLSLNANFNNIAISGLPDMFNKKAGSKKSLSVQMSMRPGRPVLMRMQYAAISAALTLQKDKHVKLLKGEIHIGRGHAEYQKQPGLLITGRFKKVVWDKWRKYFHQEKSTVKKSIKVRLIRITIDHFEILHKKLQNVALSIKPKLAGWSVDVVNKIVSGNMFFPSKVGQRWVFRLKRLILITKKGEKKETINPKKLPPLSITINHFRHNHRSFGYISLTTTPSRLGLVINRFAQNSRLMSIYSSGRWSVFGKHSRTRLVGKFASNNFGRLIKIFGRSKKLVGGRGTVQFSVNWPDVPYKFSTRQLNGAVKVNVSGGRILSVGKAQNEIGLGRLLNILSLQSLPRRLALNFKDITQKGFYFNVFRGNFYFKRGRAQTTNAYLRGPVARVRFRGTINFANKTTNLIMIVEPRVTSSLPLIIGLAGGPIAGAVAWVVNKIVEPGIGHILGKSYRVTGPWSKPRIIKLKNRRRVAPVGRR